MVGLWTVSRRNRDIKLFVLSGARFEYWYCPFVYSTLCAFPIQWKVLIALRPLYTWFNALVFFGDWCFMAFCRMSLPRYTCHTWVWPLGRKWRKIKFVFQKCFTPTTRFHTVKTVRKTKMQAIQHHASFAYSTRLSLRSTKRVNPFGIVWTDSSTSSNNTQHIEHVSIRNVDMPWVWLDDADEPVLIIQQRQFQFDFCWVRRG